jgi:hypothetical protein
MTRPTLLRAFTCWALSANACHAPASAQDDAEVVIANAEPLTLPAKHGRAGRQPARQGQRRRDDLRQSSSCSDRLCPGTRHGDRPLQRFCRQPVRVANREYPDVRDCPERLTRRRGRIEAYADWSSRRGGCIHRVDPVFFGIAICLGPGVSSLAVR